MGVMPISGVEVMWRERMAGHRKRKAQRREARLKYFWKAKVVRLGKMP